MHSEYKERSNCSSCMSNDLFTVMDFGLMPLAGNFPYEHEEAKLYPTKLLFCKNCSLLQTDQIIDPEVLFKNYRYSSSHCLTTHFTEYALYLKNKFKLNSNSRILEFGSNDGVLLKPLMNLGLNPIGIDPSVNISQLAIDKGCNAIIDFFNIDTAKKYFDSQSFDLITSSNCFAHIADIHSTIKGIQYCLKDKGHFIIEVHYAVRLINELQYDNVYHEHLYYYTINSLQTLLNPYNLFIVDYEELPMHAGIIRVTFCNNPNNKLVIHPIEEEAFLYPQIYENFSNDVEKHKNQLIKLIEEIKLSYPNKHIIGYGASGRANVLCNHLNLKLNYIVDESVERIGRLIPNIKIPIRSKEFMDNDDNISVVVILAFTYSKMIMKKLENRNFKYIIPFPILKIVNNIQEIEDDYTY
jgi:SAM-dependent methyltransferase